MTWICVAVGDDGVVLLVDGDRALERAVHGVAAQQAGALDEVVVGPLRTTMARRRRPWPPPAFSIRRRASEPADAAEAVEDDVGAGAVVAAGWPTTSASSSRRNSEAGTVALGPVLLGAGGRGRSERRRGRAAVRACSSGSVSSRRSSSLADLAGEAVGLEDADGRLVDQAAAVDGGHHVVVRGTAGRSGESWPRRAPPGPSTYQDKNLTSGSQNYLPRIHPLRPRRGSRPPEGVRYRAPAGIRSTPGASSSAKKNPPAANADPAAELLRSPSILRADPAAGRCPVAREMTHTRSGPRRSRGTESK